MCYFQNPLEFVPANNSDPKVRVYVTPSTCAKRTVINYGCSGVLYVLIEPYLYALLPPFGQLISSWYTGYIRGY